jgi:cysteine desulfurase
MRDRLIREALGLPGAHVNGDPVHRLPNNVNVSFDGTDSQSLVMSLDLQGVAASAGSACSSGSIEPSHVLTALGIPAERATAAIRLTLGRGTTDAEITYAAQALREVVTRLQRAA